MEKKKAITEKKKKVGNMGKRKEKKAITSREHTDRCHAQRNTI